MTDKTIALEDRENEDGRLFSPSAGRNREAIAEHLAQKADKLRTHFE